MSPNLQETADLITFTEKIHHEKFFFVQCQLCLGNILAGLKNDLLDLNFRCIASPKILTIFPRGLLFSVYIMVYSVHSCVNRHCQESVIHHSQK